MCSLLEFLRGFPLWHFYESYGPPQKAELGACANNSPAIVRLGYAVWLHILSLTNEKVLGCLHFVPKYFVNNLLSHEDEISLLLQCRKQLFPAVRPVQVK